MPNYDETQTSKPKNRRVTLVDVRNGAIIAACLAITYKTLLPSAQVIEPANTTFMAPAVSAPATAIVPTKQEAPQPISVTGGRLVLGTDEASGRFRDYLKSRVQEISQQGPVIRSSAQQQALNTKPSQSVAVPYVPSLKPAQAEAIIRSDIKDPGAAIETDRGTLHPAPFTDKIAQANIDARSKLLVETKMPPTVRIGAHLDGSPMTVAEAEQQVRSTLANIQDEWTLVYKAPNEKVRLYVFTDITCTYCQKLHKSMAQLLNAGISIHYLMYPRDMGSTPEGYLSTTAVKMKNIWCSVDQKEAMNSAFEGYKIPDTDCAALPVSLHRLPAPVSEHYLSGAMFNVTGTPAWFASNGKHGIGFSNAQTMISALLN